MVGKYSPVPGTRDSDHKTFGPTDLTRTYTRAFDDGPRNFNHSQVTWTTPELAPPLLTITPQQWVPLLNAHHRAACLAYA
ncbi:hypothetical protein TNCV_315501 [Trichonephila clavipes]|nr:hypothetical protein TNCV_315501 [Trichonephila clavipes]